MREEIKKLIALQEHDIALQNIMAKRDAFPVAIKELENGIESRKSMLDANKKLLTEKQLERKDLDMELSNAENAIKKHQLELNAVKSNEAYKALLIEIEEAKQKKDEVETKLLENFEAVEKANAAIKHDTETFKKIEQEHQARIADIKKEMAALEAAVAEQQAQRNAMAGELPHKVIVHYDRIRARRAGVGLAEIRDGVCKGCNMEIVPQIIDSVLQDAEIVLCENCSRILYIDEKNEEAVKKNFTTTTE